MILKSIMLENFRNYENLEIAFSEGINILYGDNGQGKTNLLESIYVLGITKSHRSFIDNSLIKNNLEIARIKGKIENYAIDTNLEIIISNKQKKVKIDNDIIKRISDYISFMNIIIFYPDDLELVKSSPLVRRRFLNIEISQLSSEYLNVLNNYNRLLKIRNSYLKNNNIDKNYYDILTKKLIDSSILIYIMRKKFIDKLNTISSKIFFDLSNLNGFKVIYKTSIEFENYEKKTIKENLISKFEQLYESEKKIKSTLIGPHKDDIEFFINDSNLKCFGSQGQQRMAVLAIKLAEIDIFENYKGKKPILLLDDVFSELDDSKKNNLLKYIKNSTQTIITTTDLNHIDKEIINNSKIFNVNNGKIIEEVK